MAKSSNVSAFPQAKVRGKETWTIPDLRSIRVGLEGALEVNAARRDGDPGWAGSRSKEEERAYLVAQIGVIDTELAKRGANKKARGAGATTVKNTGRPRPKKVPMTAFKGKIRDATKAKNPLETTTPNRVSVEAGGIGSDTDDARKIRLLLEDRLKWIDLKSGDEARRLFGIISVVLTHVGKSSDVYGLRLLGMDEAAALLQKEERTKDEGISNKALATVLREWGVPEKDIEATAAELERTVRARMIVATNVKRPKWDERGKYAELKDLSAPQFLKRVYADVIASDGSIQKITVRDIDPKLMAIVEAYINTRKSRQQDAGDAEGLRLIAGVTSPLRRVTNG